MFVSIIFSATLLLGLILWSNRVTLDKSHTKQDFIILCVICLGFVGAQYFIFYTLDSKSKILAKQSYTDSDEQLKIGKAFYLGQNLPKDNTQALSWLLLSAEQGNQEAQRLIKILSTTQVNNVETTALEIDDVEKTFSIIPANSIKTTLDDVAGMSEVKKEIKLFLEFIKDPGKFKHLGAIPPKGIMIYGPSGVGKTHLARAIAGESDVSFIPTSGSAFEDSFVGKGAARVRELFALARANKPSIIFIDEIDALAPFRKKGELQSQIQTVNQLLSEMDNIDDEANDGVFVVASTNRLDSIDSALLRPGRFDWQLYIPLPTDSDRKALFTQFLKSIKLDKDVNVEKLIVSTTGFSAADIKNLVNEAAIFAGKDNKKSVDAISFEKAFTKISHYKKEFSPTISLNVIPATEIKTQFSDIAGMSEAKEEVTEIVKFLKDPTAFSRLGAKPPSGIMIYGPPGTGKTLMARAIAGEANATFIAITGSEFDEEFVGVGAARVRELFKIARQHQPCIIFIDEFDALAPVRKANDTSGKDQTINQLLSEMDNIESSNNTGIIVIAATNRLDIIDPAVLRPGRFDRKVHFRLPTLLEREAILKVHLKKVKVANDVDLNVIAQTTTGFSGADLANLVNEAAIDATRKDKEAVDMASIEEANDKITLGVKEAQDGFTLEERKITAYHEAGHALVGILHSDHPRTLHKMTIGIRSRSLGVTHFRLDNDFYSLNKKQLEAIISTALGGYIAEEIIFGKDNVTTGAASDLITANEIARDMVTQYAMSDNRSLVMDEVFPGGAGDLIGSAEQILRRDYDVAKQILETNIDMLHTLANALLKYETLDYQQIKKILNLKPTN